MTDAIQGSTEVMQQIGALVNVPEIAVNMKDMQREMHKAGLIEEMMDESMDAMDDADMEEETQAEVEKVLDELAIDASLRMAIVGSDPAAAATAGYSVAQPAAASASATASASAAG